MKNGGSNSCLSTKSHGNACDLPLFSSDNSEIPPSQQFYKSGALWWSCLLEDGGGQHGWWTPSCLQHHYLTDSPSICCGNCSAGVPQGMVLYICNLFIEGIFFWWYWWWWYFLMFWLSCRLQSWNPIECKFVCHIQYICISCVCLFSVPSILSENWSEKSVHTILFSFII